MIKLEHTRRFTQLAFMVLVLLAPTFDLLRYDVAAKQLYLFGSAWELGLREGFQAEGAGASAYVALRFVMKAVLPWLVVLSVFPVLGVVFGRAFCGWMCPEGLMFELADWVTLKVLGRRSIYGAKASDPRGYARGRRVVYLGLALVLLMIIPPVVGVMMTGYFIAPDRIWAEIGSLEPSFGLKAGVVGVWIYMVLSSIFIRHALCKYLCGAGLMQAMFAWVSPKSLRLRFKRAEFGRCTDCKRCETVCFMDVRPRLPQRDINCINCMQCKTECEEELGKGKGLFGVGFGEGAGAGTEGQSDKDKKA